MSLFETKDLADPVDENFRSSGKQIETGTEQFLIIKNQKDIDDLLNGFSADKCIHYATGGKFSSHELLFSLLKLSGPAKVYITTWTMTEYPARLLVEGLSSGKIIELNCLLDVRMEKNESVLQLIKFNSSTIRLSHCHAKVMIIQNDSWNIVVVSSQNQTENPRIEAGVISTTAGVVNFHRDWILKEIEHGHGFE